MSVNETASVGYFQSHLNLHIGSAPSWYAVLLPGPAGGPAAAGYYQWRRATGTGTGSGNATQSPGLS